MSFTLLADFTTHTGGTYTAAEQTRLGVLLDEAERELVRATNWRFYDVADRTTDASRDWIDGTVLLAERAWELERDPEARAAALGPFASEHLGDYSYTLQGKGETAVGVAADARVAAIVERYRRRVRPLALTAMALAGPSRVAPAVYDPDEDISRAVW